MKLFIDTANVEEIREAAALGVICGVTTNPSLIAKEGPIIYREGRRKMIIESERVRPDGAIEVYTPTINNWEAPYEQDELTHEHKLKIMRNIQAKLQRQGEKVIRFT